MADKPPILFLHGAFGGTEVWRFLAPWFAARGHRVATPHLPGPGAGPALRLRDYVRRAAEAADALDAPPVLVGHSLGGLVAQHLAARREVAGLALLASPGPWGLGPSFWHLSARAPDVLAALMVTQTGGGALLGTEVVRRALFTPETPADWIEAAALVPERESPLALMDALTWDLPPWFLVRRRPVLALLGERGHARAGQRSLGTGAHPRGRNRADARLRARAADRSALEERRLADQRLAGRAAGRFGHTSPTSCGDPLNPLVLGAETHYESAGLTNLGLGRSGGQ